MKLKEISQAIICIIVPLFVYLVHWGFLHIGSNAPEKIQDVLEYVGEGDGGCGQKKEHHFNHKCVFRQIYFSRVENSSSELKVESDFFNPVHYGSPLETVFFERTFSPVCKALSLVITKSGPGPFKVRKKMLIEEMLNSFRKLI